jgi:protein phosphatase
MTLLRSAALSDIGRVRQENEDRFMNDPTAMLFGVADGIGGLPGGGEAAQKTIEEISAGIRSTPRNEQPDLAAIVQRAHLEVQTLGASLSPAMGIGSTLTFGHFQDRTLHLAHVGDSRCYALRDGEFTQLTEDHSVENEARMRRARGEVYYYDAAHRQALTRCIGQPGFPMVDLIDRPLHVGDRYLFCTDGISRVVRQAELGALVATSTEPADVLRDIIALAMRRGGPDNATGVLVIVVEI